MKMVSFTTAIATNIASFLVIEASKSTVKSVKSVLMGTPQQQALKRIFQEAFDFMLSGMEVRWDKELQTHVQGLFTKFLTQNSVAPLLIQRVIDVDLNNLPLETT